MASTVDSRDKACSSVHTVKVEQLMVCDVIYITKDMTYREMKEILQIAPHLRSFPIVTDHGG